MRKLLAFFIGLIGFVVQLPAQTIPVGLSGTEDLLRSFQLMGKIDSNSSFTSRPFTTSRRFTMDSLYNLTDSDELIKHPYHSRYTWGKYGTFELLPMTWQQQYNSHHPYGWNDAGMIQAKGYQTQLSTGFYASYGPLSIQFKPELVYAQNSNYEHMNGYGSIATGGYSKVYPGQSSIRLNAGPVSLGISTENLWFGPGIYNALLMSNNAPGFPHFTFNSTRPVKTPIGHFEWQLISGKLTDDSQLPYESFSLQKDASSVYPVLLFGEIDHDWRYINALSITYQPKWIKGLFIGLTRQFQIYHKDFSLPPSNFTNNYLPVLFDAFLKSGTVNEDLKRRDQLATVFGRWMFPSEQLELYFEFGWNDHSSNLRHFALEPAQTSAYLVGFRKIVPLERKERIEITGEFTQLANNPNYLVRNPGNWYRHYQLLQGYTNKNQVIGSGIGPGNNVQSLNVSWVNGWKRLGVLFERLQYDPVYHAVHWNDLSMALQGQQNFGHLLLNAQLQFIQSGNYAWQQGANRFNFHATTGVSYRW